MSLQSALHQKVNEAFHQIWLDAPSCLVMVTELHFCPVMSPTSTILTTYVTHADVVTEVALTCEAP